MYSDLVSDFVICQQEKVNTVFMKAIAITISVVIMVYLDYF